MKYDEQRTKRELLYELRLKRLENLRLQERLVSIDSDSADKRHLRYLESIALIDQTIRGTTNLEEMMNSLMEVLRAIFQCDQAWLLHPCDPDAQHWRVPFRSVHPNHPIHFGPEDDLPVSQDLAENCRLALERDEPLPLGMTNSVKDVPAEARDSAARSALLITLHPKVGRPWLMGLHQCSYERSWSAEEKRMYQDISARISDALSTTLFYRNLELNQARLKHLSAQLFRAQEEERKRVAEEIHDELGQATLAIKMAVENALYHFDESPAGVKRSLQSASNLSKGTVEKMRRMQNALYPPALADFGVITALNGFLNDFINIYPATVHRNINLMEKDIPGHLRVTVFRLAQEALYNSGKHSDAENITLSLEMTDSSFMLAVSDDGRGFDPDEVLRYPDTRLGLGLTSMRERAEMHHGTMEIDSKLGHGTTIRCVWPLKHQ